MSNLPPLLCLAGALLSATTWVSTVSALPPETDRWILVDTEHFHLVSNASPATTHELGRKLEQLAVVIGETMPMMAAPSAAPSRIIVFKDEASFAPYKIGSDGKPDSIAGYFIAAPSGSYLAIDGSAKNAALRTVYHEYIHLLVHRSIPYVPLWLNEGLAEFYSTTRIDGDRAEVGMPIVEHRYVLASYRFIGTGSLFAIDQSSNDYLSGPRRLIFYAQSWALTHELMTRPGTGKRDFKKLLREFQQGKSSGPAIESAYGLAMDDLERNIESYMSRPSFGYYEISFREDIVAGDATSRPLSRQEVLCLLGDLLVHRTPVQEVAAEEHLMAALALDPTRAGAHLALGLLHDQQDRFEAAAASFRQASQLGPDDATPHLCYGQSLLRHATADRSVGADGRKALLSEARGQFEQAVALDPQNADALGGLGRTCRAQGEGTQEGINACTRALQVRPWDLDVLGDLIVLRRLGGDREGAYEMTRTSLEPRAAPSKVKGIERQLAQIDRRESWEMAERGDYESAIHLLEDTAARVGDPNIRAEVAAWLAETEADAKRHADQEQYGRARKAASERKYKLAAAIYDSVAAGAEDEALRDRAAKAAEDMRRRAR